MVNKSSKLTLVMVVSVVIFGILGLAGNSDAAPQDLPQEKADGQLNTTTSAEKPGGGEPDSTECDHVPPYFTEIDPWHLKTDVPRDAILKFRVNDDYIDENTKSGVDTNNVHISIYTRNWQVEQQKATIVDWTPKFLKVRYKYQPDQLFDWSDTVTVTIWAMDRTKYYNNDDTTYTFYTVRDTMKPELVAETPQPDEIDVPVTSDIVINGTDEGRGIDFSTVVLTINEFPVNTEITGDPNNCQIIYSPEIEWPSYDSIHVVCTAQDYDGNPASLSYWFKITDIVKPTITPLYPQPGDTNVSILSDVKILITDESGINQNSIQLQINNNVVQGTFFQDTLTYTPDVPFPYESEINVSLDVEDNYENPANANYSFFTETDPTPPTIIPIRPEPGDTLVSISTDVAFSVIDDESGVDWQSLVFKINDETIADYENNNGTIRFEFPETLNYNEWYDVYIEVANNVGRMNSLNYSFRTEPDVVSPIITIIRPLPDAVNVPRTTDIVFHVSDIGTGIDFDSGILNIDDTQVNFNVSNDTIYYYPENPFGYAQSVKVDFYIADYAGNPEDTTYSFTTEADTIKPLITPVYPVENQIDVPRMPNIVVALQDFETGIDSSTITFEVPGEGNYTYENDTLVYVPNVPFDHESIVDVNVSVKDFAGNEETKSYSFTIISKPVDSEKPEIIVVRPEAYSENVPLDTDILILVHDALSGVNPASIELSLNGTVVTHTFSNDSIHYVPTELFSYNDSISVNVKVADTKNNWADATYYFKTEIDDTPPDIKIVEPLRDQTGVSVMAPIILSANDSQSGLDTTTAKMTVNGEDVAFTITNDTVFTYSHHVPFAYKSRVNVSFVIDDIAGNPERVDYGFNTGQVPVDLTPPIIEIVRPDSNETDVSISTDIVLTAVDPETYINSDSIKLWIDGDLVLHKFSNDTVSFKPDSLFEYNKNVRVKLWVKNNANLPAGVSYAFTTEHDAVPPLIEVLWPVPFSTGVAVDTSVAIRVSDAGSGLNIISATMLIDSVEVELEVKGDTLIYKPATPFEAGTKVNVDFWIEDLAAKKADTTYWFTTIDEVDTIPPQIFVIEPKPYQTGCNAMTPVFLTATDENSGVDFSTAVLKIENTEVDFTVDNDTVRYIPLTPYPFESRVDVYFYIEDFAGNPANTSYWFETGEEVDITPPIVFDHQPEIYGFSESLSTSIQFKVWDAMSGVEPESIQVKTKINALPEQPLNYTTTILMDTVFVTCEEQQFNYNDTVWVDIYAVDKMGNSTDRSQQDSSVYYYFTVPYDTTAPTVVAIYPKQLEALDDTFFVELTDDFSGVKNEALQLYLWTRKDPVQKDITGALRITVQGDTVVLEYKPDNDYNYNDSLSLKIIVEDNVGNIDTLIYNDEILTPGKLSDLYVLSLTNSANGKAIEVESSVSITALIGIDFIDCDQPFEIKFYLGHSENAFYQIECPGLRVGQLFEAKTSIELMQEGDHRVVVKVDPDPMPDGKIKEEIEYNNVMETVIHVDGAKLEVKSNPFTPNNDGFNDFADFNFEQFVIEKPKLKILDIHGKLIREFNEGDQQGKRFVWDGRDRHGKALMPGIYFYVLLSDSNPITRGCVVIIK